MRISVRILLPAALAIFSALGFMWLPQWWQARDSGVQWLDPADVCTLGIKPCEASTATQSISVSANTDTIHPEVPFVLDVKLGEIPAEQVWVQLEGVTMYMGLSRYRLELVGNGHYKAELRLPSCSAQTMTWQAQVLAQTESNAVESAQPDEMTDVIVGFEFEFESQAL